MSAPSIQIAIDDYRNVVTASFLDCYGRRSVLLNENGEPANFTQDRLRGRGSKTLLEQLQHVDTVLRNM